jgi:excisionase family DNA binding protein
MAASPLPLRERLAVTVYEAAHLLTVSPQTIRDMVDRGTLTRYDTGSPRIIRITMRSILALETSSTMFDVPAEVIG